MAATGQIRLAVVSRNRGACGQAPRASSSRLPCGEQMIAASADTFFGYFLDVWAGEPRAIPALAIHDTSDPGTIIVEQEALGSSASNGEFALPNIVVLTVRHGQIARLRDYVNIAAAAAAMGCDM
jgi:hypothetical protein